MRIVKWLGYLLVGVGCSLAYYFGLTFVETMVVLILIAFGAMIGITAEDR